MAGLAVTGPQNRHKYLKSLHPDTELDSIFKVDSVSQHMHLHQVAQVECHSTQLEHKS